MSHPLFDLSGRVALVSGAASGMGRAASIGFAEAGADLMLADINEEGLQDTVKEITRLGRRAEPVVCDVSNGAQIRAMFAKLDETYGRIDVLANIAGEGGAHRSPLEITEAGLIQTLNNLVVGAVCLLPGRRQAHDRRRPGQHHQHRVHRRALGPRPAATWPTASPWAAWPRWFGR